MEEMDMQFTQQAIESYRRWLIGMERSRGTISQYLRDIQSLYLFLPEGQELSREQVQLWKASLAEKGLAPSTINAALTAVNGFFRFMHWEELTVRLLRRQKQLFRDNERELTRKEYMRLVQTAARQGKNRLSLIMQSICATGIRISELRFLTVEALHTGRAMVDCKGKNRVVLIPNELKRMLMRYVKEKGILSGPVFVTKKGRPVDRSNVWHEMKKLCQQAGVNAKKVFPHNLRHLFAVTFYRQQKDLAKLADILGHSSIETTRIYAMESGAEHQRMINALHLTL